MGYIFEKRMGGKKRKIPFVFTICFRACKILCSRVLHWLKIAHAQCTIRSISGYEVKEMEKANESVNNKLILYGISKICGNKYFDGAQNLIFAAFELLRTNKYSTNLLFNPI